MKYVVTVTQDNNMNRDNTISAKALGKAQELIHQEISDIYVQNKWLCMQLGSGVRFKVRNTF